MNHCFEETKRFLKKVAPMTWELTEPHLLYLDEKQSADYLQVMQDQNYSQTFHNDTVGLIENHLEELFPNQKTEVSLIDLGPGYPDKSLPMAKFLKKRGQNVFYYPVDVSLKYLSIAEHEMFPYCERVTPIHSLFEIAHQKIPTDAYTRPVYTLIGLTFMNFPSKTILNLLTKLSGTKNSFVIFASEMISINNPQEKIIEAYRGPAMQTFTFGPLRHLGLGEDQVIFTPIFSKQRVEIRFVIKKMINHLPIQKGDTVITAVSYRYTENEFIRLVKHYFHEYKIWYSADDKTALVKGYL